MEERSTRNTYRIITNDTEFDLLPALHTIQYRRCSDGNEIKKKKPICDTTRLGRKEILYFFIYIYWPRAVLFIKNLFLKYERRGFRDVFIWD